MEGILGSPSGPGTHILNRGAAPVVYLCHAVAPRRSSCRIVELVQRLLLPPRRRSPPPLPLPCIIRFALSLLSGVPSAFIPASLPPTLNRQDLKKKCTQRDLWVNCRATCADCNVDEKVEKGESWPESLMDSKYGCVAMTRRRKASAGTGAFG